jgi:hypothetical protein
VNNSLTDLIVARRKAIEDAAPCEHCGATLAACVAQQGKDPTAPPWFGCCSRPLMADDRCRHVPSVVALRELLAEIESGYIRTVEEATPKPRQQGMTYAEYINQGEKWQPNGEPVVAIADMDPEWRYNASRWLERNAKAIALKYALDLESWFVSITSSPHGPSDTSADMIERDIHAQTAEAFGNQVAWIRTTVLYRALVAELPNGSLALDAIAELARHWSTCPVRTGDGDCRCDQIRARHEADGEERLGVAEWGS